MARLTLVASKPKSNSELGSSLSHRASATEGEAAIRLLQDQGYTVKKSTSGQWTTRCPFHEGPGAVESRKSANFYLDGNSSQYLCHSSSCGERGNLQSLERFFGIDPDEDVVAKFRSREERLREFERNLTRGLRQPFYDHGLSDSTIERFRLGFEPAHVDPETGRMVADRYIIPYLDGRRPEYFRYYQPNGEPKWKYTWEAGAQTRLFNAQDAMGDEKGRVFLCESEQKAMLLVQLGYAAVGVPGAGIWRDEFQAAFTHARQIIVVYDNDNPEFHVYDKPDEGKRCQKCAGKGLDRCLGHNPGQEAALARVEDLGWRAKNVILPLPEGAAKTDINEYFMRDGYSNADFAQLATGKAATPYKVQSLSEIAANPPEEAVFLVDQGILPKGGRLLVAGKPKAGKSLMVDNLALSLASGIPFLKSGAFEGFKIADGTRGVRTLLLDRELSKWSLYKRMEDLTAHRKGYEAAWENLLIDHDHLIHLNQPNAYQILEQLVEQNGAEALIMDTAYKFFSGDVESSSALMKGFEVLDKLIHETGVSIVMTHHMRKSQTSSRKENTDIADPDSVAGSFLWTGWPNATILINFLNRSVDDPFNATCTFSAFRDHATPDPLELYRGKDSVAYTAIQPHNPEEKRAQVGATPVKYSRPDTDGVENLLLEHSPIVEEDFLNVAAGRYGVSVNSIRPYYIDAMSRGRFEKTGGHGQATIIKFKYESEPEESWEHEHGLAERTIEDLPLFDAAMESM